MKHGSPSLPLGPAEIGAAVRERVEAFLRHHPNSVSIDFPARIEKFAAAIALWGARMNLTAHPDDPDEIAFHVTDCLMPLMLAMDDSSPFWVRFDNGREILDLGSGAGFPGLVLAAASPAHFTLVESRRKRASFLQYAVAEAQLDNVEVLVTRAEDLGTSCRYDIVTARAFGDSRDFFELARRLLKADGVALLYANPSQRLPAGLLRIPYRIPRGDTHVDRILVINKST